MFSDKGFADGANAEPYSGSAAVATVDTVTAVIVADKKPAVNNSMPPTSVTSSTPGETFRYGSRFPRMSFLAQDRHCGSLETGCCD